MTPPIQWIFSFLAALCAAAIIYNLSCFLFNRQPSISRSLQDYAFSSASVPVPDIPIGSPAHKIRLAFAGYGLDVSGKERFSLALTIGILGLGLAFGAAALDLPPLFWLGGPAIAYFAVNNLVNSKWNKVRTSMEKEIPSYLIEPLKRDPAQSQCGPGIGGCFAFSKSARPIETLDRTSSAQPPIIWPKGAG